MNRPSQSASSTMTKMPSKTAVTTNKSRSELVASNTTLLGYSTANNTTTLQGDPTNYTTTSHWFYRKSDLEDSNSFSGRLTPPLLSIPHIGIIAACCAAFVSLVFLGIVALMVVVKRRRAKSRARETTITDMIQPAMPAPMPIPQRGGLSVHNSYDIVETPRINETIRINNQGTPPVSDRRPRKGEVYPGMTSTVQSNSSQCAYSEIDVINSSLKTVCRLILSNEPSGQYQGQNLSVSSNNYEDTYSSLRSHVREVVNPYDTFTSASVHELKQESGNVELTRCQPNGVQASHQGDTNKPSNNYMTMEALCLQLNDGTHGNQMELGNDSPSESGEYINNFKALQGEPRLRSHMEAVETSSTDTYSQVVPKRKRSNDFYI